MSNTSLVTKIAALQDYQRYEDLHWSGTFEDYLEMLRRNPRVARTAHERLYDMVLAAGTSTYVDNKKKVTRYKFFSDDKHGGRDAIYGLDIPLMRLVNVLKAAAMRYGTEKRIILLHGPVGSSKSTIVRLLKQGFEEYSRTNEGSIFTYEWVLPPELRHLTAGEEVFRSPMNEEPLKLIPPEWREQAITDLGLFDPGDAETKRPAFRPWVQGQLNPACRFIFRELMRDPQGRLVARSSSMSACAGC